MNDHLKNSKHATKRTDKWGQAANESGADSRVVWIREVLDAEADKVLAGSKGERYNNLDY